MLEETLRSVNLVGGVKMKNMTKEEVTNKIPIGSIVEIINNTRYEDICSVGEKAEVLYYFLNDGAGCLTSLRLLKSNVGTEMFHWRFKLCKTISDALIENDSSCPNCKGELVEKYSEYVGGNIKKCKSCGWC